MKIQATTKKVRDELELVRKRGRGILKPEAVVEFARDESTTLHKRFEWDDTKAAHQHRLAQARHIINVNVTLIEGHNKPVSAYVSLASDRGKRGGGGYRGIVDVLSDSERRAEMLAMAEGEMKTFRAKYSSLRELDRVLAAMDEYEESGQKRKAS